LGKLFGALCGKRLCAKEIIASSSFLVLEDLEEFTDMLYTTFLLLNWLHTKTKKQGGLGVKSFIYCAPQEN